MLTEQLSRYGKLTSIPERGLLVPGDFVHMLEETGLIAPVGGWVLETVCAQMRAWRDAGLPPVRLREFAEFFQVDADVNLFSICSADYSPALARLVVKHAS